VEKKINSRKFFPTAEISDNEVVT